MSDRAPIGSIVWVFGQWETVEAVYGDEERANSSKRKAIIALGMDPDDKTNTAHGYWIVEKRVE